MRVRIWIDCSNGVTSAKLIDAIARALPDTRTWKDVQRFMFSVNAQRRAQSVFEVLAHAEAAAHGVATEEVHFHEVGRVENLARVLGIFAAMEMGGIEEWYASPPALGNGTVTCSHGVLSIPAPATKRIIEAYSMPTAPISYETEVGELTTPTGVALLTQANGIIDEPPADSIVLKTREIAG